MNDSIKSTSSAVDALIAAGDESQALDVAELERAQQNSQQKLKTTKSSLVERLVFGPRPELEELCSGVQRFLQSALPETDDIVNKAVLELASGKAFTANNQISDSLRKAIAKEGAYGLTIPAEFGGSGFNNNQLAYLSEQFAANGLSSLAIEISGQLTIGASALLGYGSDEQCKTYLPLIADGQLIAFALTEVGVGVNAKRVKTWVEKDESSGCWRLNADGERSKLYITSATHGGLAAIVARKGKDSREIGLFIIELPEDDVVDGDFQFSCSHSNVSAFSQNINSKLSFKNFPVPFDNEIKGNGIEVLFYCLRLGRCMLAAQCAGIQRSLAVDAINYAQKREGVGGKVIKHELPRSNITKILAGALSARALSHLSLAQDEVGVDLAGLRDLTKSISAEATMNSLYACEKVMGGRTLDLDSRITQLRPIIHAFGIVEGENDLIRLGMIKDVTAKFTDEKLAGLLSVLQKVNLDKSSKPVHQSKRIDKLGLASFIKFPIRTLGACLSLITKIDFWAFLAWIVKTGIQDIVSNLISLLPAALNPRYKDTPAELRTYICFAEQGLRNCRWRYIALNVKYQLELTRAQLPMLKLANRIEMLTNILVVCCHASKLDASAKTLALYKSADIINQLKGGGFSEVEAMRKAVAKTITQIEKGENSLLEGITAEPYAHPWD